MNATLTSSYATTVNKYDVSGIFAGMRINFGLVRSAAGLNQGQVAERLDVTQPYVSRLERHKDFRWSELEAFLDAVGAEGDVTLRVNDQTLVFPIGNGPVL